MYYVNIIFIIIIKIVSYHISNTVQELCINHDKIWFISIFSAITTINYI